MSAIRALQHDDLPGVVRLLRQHLEGWEGDAGSLAATLLDHPWADPELPSLIAESTEGRIAGFIGAQTRRVRFEKRELRGVCCSHLVVDPASRGAATGALLLGGLVRGGQDLTWSDSANEEVARMWTIFGGRVDGTRACDWMLVLRPLRWGGGTIAAAARRRELDRGLVPVAALPLQAVGRRLLERAHPAGADGVRGEDAGAAEIAELVARTSPRVRLRLDWDEAALAHTFARFEAERGPLVRRIVRHGDRPIGWYAYHPQPGGVARVLHLGVEQRDADAALGELIEHARGRGSAVIAGRSEPHLEPALRRRFAILGFARKCVVHAGDPRVDLALASSASLLSQLDGEWYVR